MSKAEAREIASMCYRNLPLFGKTFFPHQIPSKTIPSFQRKIGELFLSPAEFVAIAAPRGHGKSTWGDLIYLAHELVYGEFNFAVLISDSETQSVFFLDNLRQELETNDLLNQVFFGLQGKLNEKMLVTNTGCMVLARGAGQRVRGLKWRNFRPSLILIDDLENDELVENADRRLKLRRWFYGSLMPAKSSFQTPKIRQIGTILHEDSILNRNLKSPKWKTLCFDAEVGDEEGKSLWPEALPMEKLKEIKSEYAKEGLIDAYYREYRNIPIAQENRIFRQEQFKYWTTPGELPMGMKTFLLTDHAVGTTASADASVLMAVGIASPNIYVLSYIRQFGMSPHMFINELFRMSAYWKPIKIGMPADIYQKVIVPFLMDEMLRRGVSLPIVEIKEKQKKISRIRALHPYYSSGRVFHHKGQMDELEAELLDFPAATHDDLSDTLAKITEIGTAFLKGSEGISPSYAPLEDSWRVHV